MNLKESYRYSNYLDSLLNTAYSYLGNKGFITSTKENHLRSKANSETSDEIVEIKKPYDVEFAPNDVINFAVKVIDEKEKLVDAIATAKNNTEINIDNAISLNKKKQEFVYTLNRMADIKSTESTANGRAYKFDANMEQKPYIYDIVKTTTIDYDRNSVKGLIKKYLKETDEVSAKLDAIQINTLVDFEPLFDVNDKFEDIVVG